MCVFLGGEGVIEMGSAISIYPCMHNLNRCIQSFEPRGGRLFIPMLYELQAIPFQCCVRKSLVSDLMDLNSTAFISTISYIIVTVTVTVTVGAVIFKYLAI